MNSKNDIGLFLIPIRFELDKSVYKSYLPFLESIENFGFTHIFIGEHLTDRHEDIRSSLIFAAAILGKGKPDIQATSWCGLPGSHEGFNTTGLGI